MFQEITTCNWNQREEAVRRGYGTAQNESEVTLLRCQLGSGWASPWAGACADPNLHILREVNADRLPRRARREALS